MSSATTAVTTTGAPQSGRAGLVRERSARIVRAALRRIVIGVVTLWGAVTLVFTPEVAGKRLPGSAPAVESEQEARELASDSN